MPTERRTSTLPVQIIVAGEGVEFCRDTDGKVCIEVEHPSLHGYSHVDYRYVTIEPEDWNAIVAFIAAEMAATEEVDERR